MSDTAQISNQTNGDARTVSGQEKDVEELAISAKHTQQHAPSLANVSPSHN